jgi:hypothetical protein
LSRFLFVVEKSMARSDFQLVGKTVSRSTPIERAAQDRVLQVLALHKSTAGWRGPIWTRLRLPFSFEINNDLFANPIYMDQLPRHLREMLPAEGLALDHEQELALKDIAENMVMLYELPRQCLSGTLSKLPWPFLKRHL